MSATSKGFTLIELMIVVAIIGILAAVAIPAYQGYMVRTKWVSNLAELEGLKNAIRTCMSDNATAGTSCDEVVELRPYGYAGSTFPQPRYGSALTVTGTSSEVKLTFTGSADAQSLVYEAACSVRDDGNMKCLATSGDQLGQVIIGTGR